MILYTAIMYYRNSLIFLCRSKSIALLYSKILSTYCTEYYGTSLLVLSFKFRTERSARYSIIARTDEVNEQLLAPM